MTKFLKRLLVIICVFVVYEAAAQPATVNLRVRHLYSDYHDGHSYGSIFKFFKTQVDDRHVLQNGCIKRPEAFDYDENITLYNVYLNDVRDGFTLIMESHNERQEGSPDCDYNSGDHPDRHREYCYKDVWVKDHAPGKWQSLGRWDVYHEGTHTYAEIEMRYTIMPPTTITPQPNNYQTTFCANDLVQLGTDVLPNSTDLMYEWEYVIDGEQYEILNPDRHPDNEDWGPPLGCGHYEYDPITWQQTWVDGYDCHLPRYVTVYPWHPLPITNSNTDKFAKFTPVSAVFNNNITYQQNVFFRVRAKSSEGMYSEWSPTGVFTFLPPPPTLYQSNFTIKPSCPFPNNGRIEIPYNGINTPFTEVRWLLKNGHYNNSTCPITINPDGSITSSCGLIEQQSNGFVHVPKSAAEAPIIIDNLPKGEYTLWVTNPGESSGNCYAPLNITITEFPPLTLTKQLETNVSCFAANDGAFKIQAAGGDPGSGYQFKLVAKDHPDLSTDFATVSGNLFERTGLPAGEYTIYMKNACSPEVNTVVTLSEPVRTRGEAVFNQPTCYSPANGSVAISTLAGMGNYTYQLWKDGNQVAENAAVTDVNHFFDNLLPGNYQVKILDADRLTCPGWDSAVILEAPPVLTATILKTDSVSCYGGNDGAIQVEGHGGTGNYVFTLKSNGNVVSSNTDGLFNGLSAGVYQLIASKPANESCDDSYEQPVEVPQRSQLTATLTAQPVTCYGKNDGTVSVQAGGGSGSYYFYWEYWNGSSWQHNPFWFPTDVQISNLGPGRYRVQVSDNRSALNCTATSQEIEVDEPALLQITNVQPTDAACKADGGRIKITATGGNGGYVYFYSINDQLNYTVFTENTPLTTNGNYYVKVEDVKGCKVEDNTAYSISLPPAPMDFTMQASDYEGVSVSCYNGNNGTITVSATGGSETGYMYSLNAGAYQNTAVFNQLTAGTYAVTVKDKRGCELSKNITLTQPIVPLQGSIINKQDPGCPGTPTGSFAIDIQNGRAPYQYSIDNGKTFQTANTFTGLYPGTYQVVVKDKYDCRWTTSVTLNSTIPVVVFSNTVTNVSCFNGNNGAIQVTTSGGQPPYQYKWESFSNTTDQLGNISAGKYILHVTDGAGCFSNDTVQVAQPAAALTAVTTTQPVCVGSNGSITVSAGGGTPPYKYSANNGNTFQDNNVLSDLPAGTYNVVVKDVNSCTAAYPVVINPANAMPEINFLVASGKNALDTLVIKEVSMPIPDSVHWSFDPAAQVIENGASPRIKFNAPGNYRVAMTGFFKGCAYSIRKTVYINAYDPDAGLVYEPPVQVIDTVILYPNPNSGQFSVRVKLSRKQKLIMLVQDMGTGREVVRRTYDPVLLTDDQFALGNVSNGTYVLRVIAENDSRDVLFIIKR